MPILAVLDETGYNALDDGRKGLYVQNSDNKQYYLDITPDEAEKVAFHLQTKFDNKKSELTRVHSEKGEAAKKLAAYEALGKSADELKAALESNRPEEITKILDKHAAEKEALEKSFKEPLETATEKARRYGERLASMTQQIEIQKIKDKHGLNEAADYILRDFLKVVPTEEGSDTFSLQVVGSDGSPALVAGAAMTPDQLIDGFRAEKKFLSMFNAGSGGGTGDPARSAPVHANGSVSYRDTTAIEANIEDIASGKIRVTE